MSSVQPPKSGRSVAVGSAAAAAAAAVAAQRLQQHLQSLGLAGEQEGRASGAEPEEQEEVQVVEQEEVQVVEQEEEQVVEQEVAQLKRRLHELEKKRTGVKTIHTTLPFPRAGGTPAAAAPWLKRGGEGDDTDKTRGSRSLTSILYLCVSDGAK